MDANQIAALSGLVTAIGAIVVGFFATRTKVKLDDLAVVTNQRDKAIAEREDEKTARAKDSIETQARHDVELARKDRQIAELNRQIEERDKRINKVDRAFLAVHDWAVRLAHRLTDNGLDVPPRPAEMDE